MRHRLTDILVACKRVSIAAVFRMRQETRILHEREYLRAVDSPFVVHLCVAAAAAAGRPADRPTADL